MSDETETLHALRAAETELATRQAIADGLKQDCLATAARDIRARIMASVAPLAEVLTVRSGDAAARLLASVDKVAVCLARLVETAVDEVRWPETTGGENVTASDVHFAVFAFAYGRVDELVEVFLRHGFTDLLSSLDECDEENFVAVAWALTRAAKARDAFLAAQAANDRKVVEAIWNAG